MNILSCWNTPTLGAYAHTKTALCAVCLTYLAWCNEKYHITTLTVSSEGWMETRLKNFRETEPKAAPTSIFTSMSSIGQQSGQSGKIS